MGSALHIAISDYIKEAWTLVGTAVTRLFEAWNNDDDTKYAACPSYKGRAGCRFPVDISSVPEGAVITSVTVYVRAAKTDSVLRTITVNLLCDDDTSKYTSRTIYLTTSPTTYEVGTYTRDPRGFFWDLHRINKLIAQIFCHTSAAAVVRCYKVYCVINYRVRPTVAVTSPTGTVKTPSPTVTWTYAQSDGDPQDKADYKIYRSVDVAKPTFNPDVTPALFSRTVTGDLTSFTLPTALDPGDYYVYVRAHSSYGAKSLWGKTAFTVQGPSPGLPNILVSPDNSTSSVTLSLQDTSNLLSVQQADAEATDRDEWLGTNASIARSTTTFFNVGSASYSMTASSAATMKATSTLIECAPDLPMTARVQLKANTTGRTCNVYLNFLDDQYNVLGTSYQGSVSDSSGSWLEASCTGTSPSNTKYARMTIEVVSAGNGEVHYFDAAGIMYGSSSAWSHGGHLSRNILSADYSCHPGFASWTAPLAGGTTISNQTSGITQPGSHGPNALRLTGATIAPSISYVGAGTVFSSTSNGSSFTLNKPASVTTNDLMIAFVTSDEHSFSVTPPSGWNYVATSTTDDGSTDCTMYVLTRTATASEPSSWTDGLLNVASDRRTAVVVAYRGCADAADQFLAQNSSNTFSSTPLYLKTATLNNTNANAWRISAFAANDNAAGGTMTANQVDPATGISYVGAANAWTSTSSGSSYTINKPSGVVSGDLMIAAVSCTGSATFTAPSGWTVVRQTTASGSPATTLCVLKRTAGGSEPTSWSGTISTNVRARVVQCVAYRQADTASNQFIVENSSTSSSGSTINTATVNNTNSASWRISIFAANDNDGRSWTSNESVERADAEASWSEWFGGSEGQTLSISDSNGTVGTGNHSRSGTLSSVYDSAVSWIGIIKVLGTPPTPVPNETERVDTTTGTGSSYMTTAVYDSNGVVPVGTTNVTGTFAPGSGSDMNSMVSWVGLVVPPNPVTSGTVQATMTDYTDISLVDPAVLEMANNKITMTASFIGSTPGTPYLKMYFYRGNALIGSAIAEGNGFTTTQWTKSWATFDLPEGTTRVKGEVQVTNRETGDTVDVDQIGISFGDSVVWRAGTTRSTHPIWNVPIIEFADDDGTGYGEWQPLLGSELNRPSFNDVTGELEYVDHTLVPLTTRKYRAQTLSYGLAGDQFVSEWGPESSPVTVTGSSWWLKNIADPTQNMILPVYAETVQVELSNTATVFQPLGEEFPVVISEGYKADQFKLKLVLHRSEWVKLKKILAAGKTLFLQSDTDMAWWVRSIGNLSAGTLVSWDRQVDPIRIVDIEFVEVKPEA